MRQIECRGCGKIKDTSEFYFVDGGLKIQGIATIKCELCKGCIEYYNTKSTQGKNNYYLHWQFIACYFIAKQVFDDNKKSIKQIAQNVENGYKKYVDKVNDKDRKNTFVLAVRNFLHLFGERSFWRTNNKQRKVFKKLDSAKNSTQIINAVKEILAEDYETFRTFKKNKG